MRVRTFIGAAAQEAWPVVMVVMGASARHIQLRGREYGVREKASMPRAHVTATTAMWALAATAGVISGVLGLRERWSAGEETLQPGDVALPGTRFLSLPGGVTAYLEEGAGTLPVILVHGFAGFMYMWRQVQSRLAAHARVVALDLWGFGASARPPHLAPDDWVRQLIQFMDALDIPQAVLVGHSLGGRVVLTAVAQYPARVRGVVLISSDGAGWPLGFQLVWAVAHTPLAALILHRVRRHTELLRLLLQNAYASHQVTHAEVREFQRFMRVRGTARAWTAASRRYPGNDLHQLIPQVRCPTALLWGADDHVIPLCHALRLLGELPDAELLIFPDAGHMLHLEHPDHVSEYLLQFLERM